MEGDGVLFFELFLSGEDDSRTLLYETCFFKTDYKLVKSRHTVVVGMVQDAEMSAQ